MTKTKQLAIALTFATGVFCAVKALCFQYAELESLRQKAAAVEARTADDQKLTEFIGKLMEVTRTKLSDLQRKSVTRAIVRVTAERFTTLEHRQAFATVIAIESKFDRNAKSLANAVGISQVLVKYVQGFSDQCKLGTVSATDLTDTETNLQLGACQFRQLLDTFDGNIPLSLAAYNAGQSSEAVKQMKGFSNVKSVETSNYVVKFAYIQASIK